MITRTTLRSLLLGSALAVAAGAAHAVEYEPDDDEAHTSVVYEVDWVSGSQAADPAAVQADLDYVVGMREHHAGALTMSEEYFAQGKNPVLRGMAKAIIANQRFEIAVLDEVKRQVEQPPKVLIDFGASKLVLRPVATDGLEHRMTFLKAPPPGRLDYLLTGNPEVDEYDVKWAKAMIVHHQGALDMARAYNADPNGQNSFLRRMNLDILQDQTYEIGFLENLVARYPGDASAIAVDPSMVHGMDMHGGTHQGSQGHGAMTPGMDHKAMGH